MALTTIEYGSLANSATLNNNFNYLDGRITTTATTVSTLSSQISTINTNLTNNKANADFSNVTESTLTSKLSSSVLTTAGCLTSENISSASDEVKATVVSWGMPDYNNQVSRSNNTEYQATSDGWLIVTYAVANENHSCHLKLGYSSGSYIVDYNTHSSVYAPFFCAIPIRENMYYTSTDVDGYYSQLTYTFAPCIGG